MKYIDAEKLIATLERQNVDKKVIEPLIRIIDSLQQEHPDVHYTKRNELFDKCVENCDPKVMQEVSDNVDKLKSISTPAEEDWFKIAEEWEKEDKKSVTDCNELEDAADNYISPIENEQGLSFIGFSGQDIKDAFIAGAEWQKEQMMEEAVEAKIYGYDDGSFELIASWLDMPKNSIYKDGQKVRIIIVEEDKQ